MKMRFKFIFTGILGLALLLILGYLVSPLNSWVHPEIQLIDNYLIKSYEPFYKNIFNWQALEFAPRYTRPLSSLVQILDSKIRYKLPPSFLAWFPSFSIVWLITLVINPFLVVRLCRGLGLSKATTLMAGMMYLFSASNLSDAVMMFRSGKPLAQMFLILATCYTIERTASKDKKLLDIKLFIVLLLGLFSDEGGWIGVAVAGVLLVSKEQLINKSIKYAFWLVIILMVYTAQLELHKFASKHIWGLAEGIGSYFILKPLFDDPIHVFPALFIEVLGLTYDHALIFYRDITGFYPYNTVAWFMRPVMVVSGIGFVTVVMLGLRLEQQKDSWLLQKFLLLTLLSVGFHSLLMAVVGNKIFGPYYYASYVSLFVLILFAIAFDNVFLSLRGSKFKNIIWFIPVSCTVAAAYVFCATNKYMKYIHYYRPGTTEYREMFRNDIDRFNTPVIFDNPYLYARKLLSGGGVLIFL